ncbi:hypothetical protein [Variovorax sp. WS11]|uniref:hypothetical protein n=1 Tax=Variovorax sp. WS11 TaxID=1105204 RepID=UPI0015E767AF|nr:hypothetical protein [Variovorax sp. WS11]
MPVRGQRRAIGTHHASLLLRASDVQHAFVGVELVQVSLREVVLALVLGKAHQIHPDVGHEPFDVDHERRGLGCHPGGRGKALARWPRKYHTTPPMS